MSLEYTITELKNMFEKNIFQPASREELDKRREGLITDDDLIKLEEEILKIARDEADDLYKQLEKQYDYIMSDEGIAEDLTNNDRDFQVDPETGRLLETTDIFKAASKKETEARKAKAKAERIKMGSVGFEDLTDEDKEIIIKKYQDDPDYPGYEWWDGDIGDTHRKKDGTTYRTRGYFDEELEKKGFEDTEIHFSGFYSQGDGACFSCSLNVKKIVEHYKIEVRPLMKQEINAGEVYGRIKTSGRYYHSHTMDINLDYEGDLLR